MTNLEEIIKYEIAELGPQDQIEALRCVSSYTFALAEAIEAEEELINFEAGLEATETQEDLLRRLVEGFDEGDEKHEYCEGCDGRCELDDDVDDVDEDHCLECRIESLERTVEEALDPKVVKVFQESSSPVEGDASFAANSYATRLLPDYFRA